jgi:hypothetical protein
VARTPNARAFCRRHRPSGRFAIREDAQQVGDLGDPSTVIFVRKLDRKFHLPYQRRVRERPEYGARGDQNHFLLDISLHILAL